MKNSILKGGYLFLVYFFLYAPIFVLIILSFNASSFGTRWEGFTLKWYVSLWHNSQLVNSALNSLLVAVSSATFATFIGTLGSVTIFRFNFFGKKFIMTLLYILMISPEIVMGISMLILFMSINMPLGYQTLLITHTTFCLPFVTAVLFTRLADFDKNSIEAAKDLGATELQTFWYIILPSILPAVVAAWLMSFTLSMDDSISTFFTTGPNFEVLPLRIYSMVRLGVKPEVNALSAIIFAGCLVIVFIVQFLFREKRKNSHVRH